MANSQITEIKVGVIGAGVMGEALIAALIRFGCKPDNISFAEKRMNRSEELVAKYGAVCVDSTELASRSQVLLLVVKPQDMESVLSEISSEVSSECLVVTFAAGKKIASITKALKQSPPVIRVMPNTPTLIGAGVAAISLGEGVSDVQREFVLGFLAATGKVIEVPEAEQDAVTATSGSGPAYFFAFVESMIDASIALGLSRENATTLAVQTFIGSAQLLEQSGESVTTLRERVTSPNGTTAAALESFSDSHLNKVIESAMRAAHKRSQELA